ncbi:MAG: LamG-like jellyroll fold domain-containing protein, partial [Acutalibacteraceae bacterium]|nr:LamG-like jellyroll fold domain-containing protein [Acutalibacteraceae bacterium]
SEDVENLADNVENAAEYTHLAVRIKLVDDGTGNAVEGATHPISIAPAAAGVSNGYFGAWADYGNVYFQDINTGEKTFVKSSYFNIPLGFDGYLVYPSNAVIKLVQTITENADGTTTTKTTKTHTSLADLVKFIVYIHWNCKHISYNTSASWVGTELYIGDMIITKNIESFNLEYGAPIFNLTSNDTSVAVISDDANAVYSFDKNAETWLTKAEFNAAAKNLNKGTNYTVYAKYPASPRIITREIATTNTGIAGYLMDIPEEETWLNYNNKYISWGTDTIVMTPSANPLSSTPIYAGGGNQGLFVRKSGDEHFIVFNPKDAVSETTGLIPEANVGLYWNTISGRGLDVAEDGTTSAKKGMPENIDTDTLKAMAIRFKITGGEADQYSSVSLRLGESVNDWLQISRGYLIDNNTGLVMNPYFQDNINEHLVTITGEFDGWLVLPYEFIFTSHRKFFEESGNNIALYFHTSGCTKPGHGPDAASDWQNKIFWLGDIALIDNEDAFLNTFSRPVTDSEGMVFTSNDHHTIDGAFTEMTNTFETWIKFNDNYPDTIRGGMMLSNANNASNSITYEILANGNPSVSTTKYSYGQPAGSVTKTFDKVNVYTGEWTHLAIVNDQTADTITCYINGVAVQTLEGALADSINREVGVLGGSFAPGNPLAFRGEMKSVALYSDTRTAEEITADMTIVGTDSLMAYWDLSKDAVDGKLTDESGNGHDVTLGKVWFNAEVDPNSYDYSFAIVGDTQYMNNFYYDRYSDIYDWIVENKEERKIEYVLNMGDITENNSDTQWQRAATEHAKLDGLVPYTVLRGNHDKTGGLNAAFNKAPYNTSYSGSYDGKVENTWRELVVCGVKYLIFTLDIGPSDDVLAWAGRVIEDHPYHNVIITTHVYLDKAGTPMNSSYNSASTNPTYGGGGNDAEEMWDKLIGKYENIVMVLCGHVSANTAVSTTRVGEHGNVVTQMLVDPQSVYRTIGDTGMITILNFSENGTKVSVETLSTVRDMHFISQGQYEITLPVT